MAGTDSNGVVRFSARNPHPVFVQAKDDTMVVNEVDWKWDEKIKDLVPYIKGKVDLQAVTDSYKDQTGVKNILAMIAQGDYSMVREPFNLEDTTIYPDNIHDAKMASDAAKKAAAALDGIKIQDSEGQFVSGVKLSQKDNEEIQKIVSAYLAGKTEGAKDDAKHE